MKISRTISEATIEELLSDPSSKIYFHGASNDRGQDPDNRTIEAPSPNRPFYITNSIDTAISYSRYWTGDDGRISDEVYHTGRKRRERNPRVYLLRLDPSKKIFDFTKKSDLSKLSEILLTENSLEDWTIFLNEKTKSLMEVAESIGFQYHYYQSTFSKLKNSKDFPENIKSSLNKIIKKFPSPINKTIKLARICALNLLGIVDPMDKVFSDKSSFKSVNWRRYIKAKLFDLVLKKGYFIIEERDTLNLNQDVKEYAIIDISSIKDISPIPLKITEIQKMQKKIQKHNDVLNVENLEEAGLILNNKDGAYPKSDQVLIMAGGAGSGKSFILDKLLLFNGKVFNPDETLELLIKYGRKYPNSRLAKKFKDSQGKELKNISLKDSLDADLVYDFLAKTRLHLDREAVFFKCVQKEFQKPNVIFDIQMKNLMNVEYIYRYALLGGYKAENVHLVWVLNDVNIALNQNYTRDRTVDSDFLKKSHIGVAETFNTLIKYTDEWRKVIDGDIWIVFNKKGIDIKTKMTINRKSDMSYGSDNDKYRINISIDDEAEHPYFAVHMKERGKPAKNWNQIDKAILDKIKSYVPNDSKNLF